MKKEHILDLINNKKYIQLQKEVATMNEVDIAEILEDLDVHTTLVVFRMLSKDLAVEVFAHFPTEHQKEIITSINDDELSSIIEELFFDDMIDLIEEMPANIVSKILSNTKEDKRKLINQFLNYPPDSAGSLMTIEYVILKKTLTVKGALMHIKKVGLDRETVYTCYVTDEYRKLEGIVSLRKLVISDDDLLIEEIMNTEFISLNTKDDQEFVANVFKKYGFLALPVTDKDKRLTGIITVDDIMDVIDQEATEDFQKMAAMSPSEDAYLDTSVITLAKNRLPWLLILMISATFTGGIIKHFEEILQSVVALTAFIPMLMDSGGNSGNQPSVLVIRGLALGEIQLDDIFKIMWKEFRISLIVGSALSVINFFRILIFENVGFLISFTVSITLFLTIIIAKLVGGSLPIIAKRFKLDPAIMAGPLVTTIVDALSLMIYFSISSLLLNI